MVSASQSQKVTLPRLWVKQAVTCPDGPFPASGEGAGGAEPSAASGGCSEAEHPQRSKKSSKRAARRFFRAPQGGRGRCCRRLPLERICAQYGFGFFAPEKSKSVSSTAKRQRGLQRGKLGSHLPCFASFCRSKRKAPAASGAHQALQKAPRRRQAR